VSRSRRRIGILAVILAVAGVGLVYWWLPAAATAYEVRVGSLSQQIVASGRVVTSSRVQIGSEILGRVSERAVREGEAVAPGDVLLVLDSTELSERVREARAALAQLETARRPQAEAALADARSHFEQARREHERARSLLERNLVSVQTVEQAAERETAAAVILERARLEVAALAPGGSEETLLLSRLAAAETALNRTVIRSPVAGTVLSRHVEPGDVVQPGKVLLEISRTGERELLVPFDERHLGRLAVGQPARCVTDAYPDQPFDATISLIAPVIDPARGTVDVRLTMMDEPLFLREDMTVTVNVETGRRERALVIPNDALISINGTSATVHVVDQGNVAARSVRTGLRGMLLTEIVEGLAEGDIVLADRGFTPGQRVRVRVIEHPPQTAATDTWEPGAMVR
jgi:HlyD family secretion protein